jgi:Spy/CpxP family protein refolding chaperone
MKKVYVVLAVVMFVALATTVFAFGPGPGIMGKDGNGFHRGGDMGLGPMGFGSRLDLSSEQRAAMQQLMEKYRVDTQTLRDELIQKRTDLRAAYADPKASDAAILARQKEANTLMQKMRDKMVQLKLEQRKIFTPEQLVKMSEAAQQRQGKGPGRGFGGRGFGPGACGRM